MSQVGLTSRTPIYIGGVRTSALWKGAKRLWRAGGRNLDPFWTPANLPSLELWLDASDASTITDAGSGAVSQWSDKSDKGRNWVQATAINRPTTGTRTINGLNAIDFNGSQWLRYRLDTSLSLPLVIAVVGHYDAFQGNIWINGLFGPALSLSGDPLWRVGDRFAYHTGLSAAIPHLTVATFNDTSSTLRVDSETRSFYGGAWPTSAWTATDYDSGIGARYDGSAPVDAGFGEMVISNEIVGGMDLVNLENYLMLKWGIT